MDEQQRSGFWSTLPGVLAGTAALITAATGGFLAFDRSGNPAMVRAPQMETRPEPKPLALVGAAPAEASTSATPVTSPAPSAPPRLEIASGTPRPSFNCALASTAVENMLCSDVGLAERDRQVASQYYALRGSLPPTVRSQLLQSQRFFLDQRSHCTTSECLSELYDNRLRQLSEFASN